MVDRGFNIGDFVLQRRVKLHVPPFTRKPSTGREKALNQSEILKTRKIAPRRTGNRKDEKL